MSKPARPALIGAFVLGAIVLIIAGVIILGGGKFFQRRTPIVMFFEGSVSGLSVGSSVNFRGVKVGQVGQVFIRYQPDGNHVLVIPVFAELSTDNVQLVGTPLEKKEVRRGTDDTLRELVDRGLRAQLALPSLVTGQATITLDFFPGTPADFANTYPDRVEIPTVPSTLQEVQATIEQVIDKVSQLPLDELVDDTRNLVKGANKLVNDPAIIQAVTDAAPDHGRPAADGAHDRQPHGAAAGQHRDHLGNGQPDAAKRPGGDCRNRCPVARNVPQPRRHAADGSEGSGAGRCDLEVGERRHPAERVGQLRGGHRAARDGRGRPLAQRPCRPVAAQPQLPAVRQAGSKQRRPAMSATRRGIGARCRPAAAGSRRGHAVRLRRALHQRCAAAELLRPEAGQRRPAGPASVRGPVLAVAPVQVPQYLSQKSIVTRTGANEVVLAPDDLWAGPLGDNITSVLAENLSSIIPGNKVVALPVSAGVPVDYEVRVEIVSFERSPTTAPFWSPAGWSSPTAAGG